MPPESVPLSSATTFDRGSPPTRDRESLSTTYFIAPAEPPGGKAAPEKKYTACAHRAAPAALPAQPKRAPGPPLGLGHRRPPHDHSADQGSAPHPQHTHRAAWGARDSRGGPGTTTLARTGQWRQGQHQLNSSNIFDLGRAQPWRMRPWTRTRRCASARRWPAPQNQRPERPRWKLECPPRPTRRSRSARAREKAQMHERGGEDR